VPEEPIYVRGKRGPKKAYEPIWVMPADLEPLLPICDDPERKDA
jgi:hypothetical protein